MNKSLLCYHPLRVGKVLAKFVSLETLPDWTLKSHCNLLLLEFIFLCLHKQQTLLLKQGPLHFCLMGILLRVLINTILQISLSRANHDLSERAPKTTRFPIKDVKSGQPWAPYTIIRVTTLVFFLLKLILVLSCLTSLFLPLPLITIYLGGIPCALCIARSHHDQHKP